MRKTSALFAAVAVGSLIAAGAAFAANEATTASSPTQQTAVTTDFGKLSADGSKAFQDLTLTRLAIYDGDTKTAKTMIDKADAAFTKAKSDESVYMKAEQQLMTPQQMAAKQQAKTNAEQADAKGSESKTAEAKQTAAEQTVTMTKQGQMAEEASKSGGDTSASAKPVAWLPVDGAISLDEDYTANPTKAKAVADANKSLAKGDSKGALDKLKLADVSMSVALEVVPLQQTIADVHQAASLIDSGKYYEGSQVLRKVQGSARYDVADYIATPKGAVPAAAAGSAPAVR